MHSSAQLIDPKTDSDITLNYFTHSQNILQSLSGVSILAYLYTQPCQ